MIVLDTNVISETQKKAPDPAVMDWLDAQDPTNLYLSTITAAELVFGVQSMPEGKRNDGLAKAVAGILQEDFAGRLLPFDEAAAWVYGERIAAARKRGYKEFNCGRADCGDRAIPARRYGRHARPDILHGPRCGRS